MKKALRIEFSDDVAFFGTKEDEERFSRLTAAYFTLACGHVYAELRGWPDEMRRMEGLMEPAAAHIREFLRDKRCSDEAIEACLAELRDQARQWRTGAHLPPNEDIDDEESETQH